MSAMSLSPNPYHASRVRIDLDRAAAQNLDCVAAHPYQRAGRAARRRAAMEDAAAPREASPRPPRAWWPGLAGEVRAGGGQRAAEAGRPAPARAGATTAGPRRTRRRPARPAAGARRQRDGQRARPVARIKRRRASGGTSRQRLSSIAGAVDQHRDRLALGALQPRAGARAPARRARRRPGHKTSPSGRRPPRRAGARRPQSDLLVEACVTRARASAPGASDSAADLGVAVEDLLAAAARSASTLPASLGRPRAMIWAASRPAFSAPPTATVATGMPGGICTVESSESKPPRAHGDRHADHRPRGVRGDGARQVRRAARAADNALTPRPASFTNAAVSSGVRCAESTRTSTASPSASSTLAAGRMVSRSDFDPIMIATSIARRVAHACLSSHADVSRKCIPSKRIC